MKIKINLKNPSATSEKIETALRSANGRGDTHTFNYASQILAIAEKAENALSDFHIFKKDRAGAVCAAESGSAVPSAYKWARKSTKIVLKREKSGWFLTDVVESTIFQEAGEFKLNLTPSQLIRAANHWLTATGINAHCRAENGAAILEG
tara:strand:+ start:168 stop:617 length:450 start_codon:yes stop_codon:yes gene_type:complete